MTRDANRNPINNAPPDEQPLTLNKNGLGIWPDILHHFGSLSLERLGTEVLNRESNFRRGCRNFIGGDVPISVEGAMATPF